MTVSVTTRGPLIDVVLDRPEKHNAFDEHIIATLTDIFTRQCAQPGLRVCLLRANGKHFSAGADLDWMQRMADMDWQQNHDDALALAALMAAIANCPLPVICQVQGAAYGGALGLICASDIALATPDSRFCLSEVKLGLLPAVISPYVVEAMGPRQARRYFLSGEVFDAGRAQLLGIVHEVVDADAMGETINALIAQLALGAPDAQRRARQLVSHVSSHANDSMLHAWTADLIARLRTGDEGREGVSAFLEKRPASWRQS